MLHSKDKITAFSKTRSLQFADKILSLQKPAVMGILNITPDSFYDGGKHLEKVKYLAAAAEMLQEGAAILDLGAVSTRPGAREVSEEEELERLIPALKNILEEFPDAIVSVDTFRSEVARQAAGNGAFMINDISGGSLDTAMFSTIASLKIPYILMHMQGTPSTMQIRPHYENVAEEVRSFFIRKLDELAEIGVRQLLLDPGFGFGKSVEHNYSLLHSLGSFRDLGFPILAGLSRKSMINRLLSISPAEALHATGVLNTLALIQGADILRVHDVKEAMQVVRLVGAYENEIWQ